MAHVELSLSESTVPRRDADEALRVLDRWADAVAASSQPCLVIDGHSAIVVASSSVCNLLGLPKPINAAGLSLLGGALRLLDFTTAGEALSEADLKKIPPVLAITSRRLARGLLRVQVGDEKRTIDVIATPLLDDGAVVGSLSFFIRV
jgi:PAS domain-containing protein